MKYSKELKAKLVSQLMSPGYSSMSDLSEEFNVTIDLAHFILSIRHDLREIYGFNQENNLAGFLGWILQVGLIEYRALAENRELIQALIGRLPPNSHALSPLQYLIWQSRPDVQAAFPLPEQRDAFLEWFYTHGLREHVLWDFLSEEERQAIEQLCLAEREARMAHALRITASASSWKPTRPILFGVNVVGYAFGQLGIGEDARMAARSLLAAKIPMAMLNFPPGADIPQNDRSMASHVSEDGRFSINLFCLTAEETGRFYLQHGCGQFQNRYNIGYWPWELGKWPEEWSMLLDLVDEVWVSTKHTYDALSPVCNKPIFIMPMAVDLGPVTAFSSRESARLHFGLPKAAKLFCFAFDLNSYVDRKNPQACVDAFLQAFPSDTFGVEEVGLVIKVHKPSQPNPAWDRLKHLASKDQRIHIIESTLSRPDLLALYKACDAFISLHRAEGFGRGLAEALQLGLHVITTGYSGNVDFCELPFADLVDYTLIPVNEDQYPHAAGQVWAEPDVDHAAQLMREFLTHKHDVAKKSEWTEFSVENVGRRYRSRLLEISQKYWRHP